MEKTDNPYTVIGVSETADEATIKKAYFQLAKKWHPDKQKTDAEREVATKTFAKIADAYEMLQDPVRMYDWRQAHKSATSAVTTSSRPMRSLSPKRDSNNAKRAPSNQPMPHSKRATVHPTSVRAHAPGTSPMARPSVRVSASPAQTSGRKSARSPVRNSGGTSPLRTSGRSPVRTSGGRSPVRTSGGRSPVRNSGGATRSSSGQSQTRPSSVRKPVSDTHLSIFNGTAPSPSMSRPAPSPSMGRGPAPGRKQVRPSSLGRKPTKKTDLDARSEHGARKPAGDLRRRLKKTLSLKLQ